MVKVLRKFLKKSKRRAFAEVKNLLAHRKKVVAAVALGCIVGASSLWIYLTYVPLRIDPYVKAKSVDMGCGPGVQQRQNMKQRTVFDGSGWVTITESDACYWGVQAPTAPAEDSSKHDI